MGIRLFPATLGTAHVIGSLRSPLSARMNSFNDCMITTKKISCSFRSEIGRTSDSTPYIMAFASPTLDSSQSFIYIEDPSVLHF